MQHPSHWPPPPVERGGVGSLLWSTQEVPASRRAGYWSSALQQAHGGVLTFEGSESAQLVGSLEQVRAGGLTVTRVHAVAQELRAGAGEGLVLVTDLRNGWELDAGGQLHQARPEDVAVFGGDAAARLRFTHPMDTAVVVGTAEWARRWLPQPPGPGGACVVARESGWGRVLSSAVVELAAEPAQALRMPGEGLGGLLGAALAAALDPLRQAPPRPTLVEGACAYCAPRLHQRELQVGDVAAALAVSVRTLERAFAVQGTTFQQTLRELRLRRAAELLGAPGDLAVALVGERCGFVSASHFVREFRRLWGMTPGDWRARHAARRSRDQRRVDAERFIAAARERVARQQRLVAEIGRRGGEGLRTQAEQLLRDMERTLAVFEEYRDTLRLADGLGGEVE